MFQVNRYTGTNAQWRSEAKPLRIGSCDVLTWSTGLKLATDHEHGPMSPSRIADRESPIPYGREARARTHALIDTPVQCVREARRAGTTGAASGEALDALGRGREPPPTGPKTEAGAGSLGASSGPLALRGGFGASNRGSTPPRAPVPRRPRPLHPRERVPCRASPPFPAILPALPSSRVPSRL